MRSKLFALFVPVVAIWPAVAHDAGPGLKMDAACLALNQTVTDLVAKGRLADAEAVLSGVLPGPKEGTPEPYCLWLIHYHRATVIGLSGRISEAEALAERSLKIMDGLCSPGDPARLGPLHLLWSAQQQQEKMGRARQTFRKMQLLRLEAPRDQAAFHGAAASQLHAEGKLKEAETQYLKAIDAWRELGSGETTIAALLVDLGKLQMSQGRYPEAGTALDRALTIVQSVKEAVPMDLINVVRTRGVLFARQGKWQAAAEDYGPAMAMVDRDTRLDPGQRKLMMDTFAYILRKAHRTKEARSIEALALAMQAPASTTGIVDVSELANSAKTRKK